MKILILNRRDIKNPAGGGAEVYTHEIAKGLAKTGNSVTAFSCSFAGSKKEEAIDGVLYLRKGSELTVHVHGFLYALKRRRAFDVIIDEYNGLGFFTFPLKNSMILIHQLYREFWLRELGPPGALPYVLEPLILRLYRKRPAVTVSPSTKEDLQRLGFRKITMVMNALGNPPLKELPKKEEAPTMIFLGRFRSTKKPADALGIFESVRREIPEARLWMVGRGPEEERLKESAEKTGGVTFFGWVQEEEKFELLGRAHVLLVPSVREGFGINVIEAASVGTPSVGYDVPGLKDSIRDGLTGFLAKDAGDAAQKALKLLGDEGLYRKTALNCLEYSKGFNWESRVEEFSRALKALFFAG